MAFNSYHYELITGTEPLSMLVTCSRVCLVRCVPIVSGHLFGSHLTDVLGKARYGLDTLPNSPVWFGANSKRTGTQYFGNFGIVRTSGLTSLSPRTLPVLASKKKMKAIPEYMKPTAFSVDQFTVT